jgi:hypothetical protein
MKSMFIAALLITAASIATAPMAGAAETKTEKPKDDAVAEEIPGDPAKFFLFHMENVSADQARGDLIYCIEQARPILSMRDRMPSGGGLLGAVINGRMAEIDRFRMRNAAMRKCMGMMGYDRYLVPEDIWKVVVNEGDIVLDDNALVDIDVVERMVAFASGPTPAGERLPR